jgi:hypothetical protein
MTFSNSTRPVPAAEPVPEPLAGSIFKVQSTAKKCGSGSYREVIYDFLAG